jgi:hypothetical protein
MPHLLEGSKFYNGQIFCSQITIKNKYGPVGTNTEWDIWNILACSMWVPFRTAFNGLYPFGKPGIKKEEDFQSIKNHFLKNWIYSWMSTVETEAEYETLKGLLFNLLGSTTIL